MPSGKGSQLSLMIYAKSLIGKAPVANIIIIDAQRNLYAFNQIQVLRLQELTLSDPGSIHF